MELEIAAHMASYFDQVINPPCWNCHVLSSLTDPTLLATLGDLTFWFLEINMQDPGNIPTLEV